MHLKKSVIVFLDVLTLFKMSNVLSACMFMYHMCAWYLKAEDASGTPGTRVTVSVSRCGYWDSNKCF